VIDRRWLTLPYPSYWHYDVLQALLSLSRLGKACDPRAADPLDLLVRRRRADGRWQSGGCWWRRPGTTRPGSCPLKVVDWGRSGPNEMLTLNALRVLHTAGWSARLPSRSRNSVCSCLRPEPVAADQNTGKVDEPEQDVAAPLVADPQPP
jgi:hypothetical protein